MKRLLYFVALAALFAACDKTEDPSISINGKTEYTLSTSAVVVPVSITTNQADWGYDFGAASAWLTASKVTAGGMEINVSANSSEDARTADVVFFAPKSSRGATVSLRIRQEGKPFEPELKTEPETYIELEPAAGKAEIIVSTNLDSWDFAIAGDWLSGAKDGGKLVLDVQENPVDEPRQTTVDFYAPGKENYTLHKTVKVLQKPADIKYDPVNLSENGTSNCYVITHKGPYNFIATVRGNGRTTSSLDPPAPLAPASAKLVWQSAKDMIKSVKYDAATSSISFEAERTPGNALIAALDESGAIIWSWHIWHPSVEIKELRSSEGSYMMNVNLGALSDDSSSVDSFGLLYQWGRKDPFPGSPVNHGGNLFTTNAPVYDINGNEVKISSSNDNPVSSGILAYSIAHPTVCISNRSHKADNRDWLTGSDRNDALWGNPGGAQRVDGKYVSNGAKSFYDPCPPGWTVPAPSALCWITSTTGLIWATGDTDGVLNWAELFGPASFAGYDINEDGLLNLKDYYDGWFITLDESRKLYSYFPATTRYDGEYGMLMGSMVGLWANYWYNAPSDDDDMRGFATAMAYGIKDYGQDAYTITASGVADGSRADAYAVRCVRE